MNPTLPLVVVVVMNFHIPIKLFERAYVEMYGFFLINTLWYPMFCGENIGYQIKINYKQE